MIYKCNTETELLAPAKDKETAFAAIDCGADAVYMGASEFGARKQAGNTIDDIKEVVNYAHKYWVKVHVTVNTILTDSELEKAVDLVRKLAEIGVDAVIIQDMGLLNKLMMTESKLPQIHISTQCDNYLPEKIRFFNDIGISRVVLARELPIKQINKIHKENPNLELECFIHGALCVSMSGQCYLSQYIGGRSANRGECAQPCRKQYDIIDDKNNTIAKDIYPLCLKDFNGSKYINELINAGICSFKIEGRLKDISYVKNIVAYYRTLLGKGSSSGKCVYPFIPNPEKTFNRGFTNYFLKGRENCFSIDSPKSKGEYLGKIVEVKKEYFVIETDKELHPQDGLYFNNNGCGVNKVVGVNIGVRSVKIYPNKKVKINIGDKIYRNLDVVFEKELAKHVKRQVGVHILISAPCKGEVARSAVGGVNVILTDEDGINITASIPSKEQAKNPKKMKDTFLKQINKTGEGDFYICDIKIAPDIVLPFMTISEVNLFRKNLFNKLIQKRLEMYEAKKIKQKEMQYVKYFNDEVDYRANIHNKSAKEFYEKCGARVKEYSLETKIPNRQIELMRCKHCIKFALNMCKSPDNLFLKDTHGKIYPLKFDCKKCEMTVLTE